jgi:hypothetical protein
MEMDILDQYSNMCVEHRRLNLCAPFKQGNIFTAVQNGTNRLPWDVCIRCVNDIVSIRPDYRRNSQSLEVRGCPCPARHWNRRVRFVHHHRMESSQGANGSTKSIFESHNKRRVFWVLHPWSCAMGIRILSDNICLLSNMINSRALLIA